MIVSFIFCFVVASKSVDFLLPKVNGCKRSVAVALSCV